MKVRIAFATGPDGQIDVGRVGTIEDLPDDEARRLIKAYIAVEATDADIADFEAQQAYERSVTEPPSDPERVTTKPRRVAVVDDQPPSGPDGIQ